jgi:hypothetical protein
MNCMKLYRWLPVVLGLFAATACTDEAPTDVGDDLLPSGDVRTFEVILDPAGFLTFDTTFTGYTTTRNANWITIANQFSGVVDANGMFRFGPPPRIITVRGASGSVVDSFPRYFEGRLVLRLDTLMSQEPPVRLRAYRTAEEWDASATWTLRVDSGNVELPWATPGGTRGASIDTATWAAGDSIVLRVDSVTLAQWIDTTNTARGAVVVSETPDSRVRISGVVLRVSAHSSLQADTVVNFDVTPIATAFIFNPPPPPAGSHLRVGGVPSWRSMIGIRPDLANLTFPCPGVAGCQVRLSEAHIARAELLLQPAAAPPGYIPEDTTFVGVRTLLVTPGIPLERSPIGGDVCGGSPACLFTGKSPPEYFAQPPGTEPVAYDVTNYIIALVDEDVSAVNRPPFALTILIPNEPLTFGFATFAPGPRLRLVLTAHVERPQ